MFVYALYFNDQYTRIYFQLSLAFITFTVHPTKSVIAVVIANGPYFGIPEIVVARISTSRIRFLLGITGLMEYVYKIMSLPFFQGIQLPQKFIFSNDCR